MYIRIYVCMCMYTRTHVHTRTYTRFSFSQRTRLESAQNDFARARHRPTRVEGVPCIGSNIKDKENMRSKGTTQGDYVHTKIF